MRDRFAQILESIKTFWTNLSRQRRVLILSTVAGIIIVSVVIVVLLNRKDEVVLFDNLGNVEMAQVLAALQEMQVPATLSKDGTAISIPASNELTVRMNLATQGIPDSGAFDYSTFQQGMGLTATQLEKNAYLVYQTQDRLAATIETFDEVAKAVVTISVPERSMFVLQEDRAVPTASVKITKKRGQSLTSQQVYGIVNIVKAGVSGLTEENISVIDETGDLKRMIDESNNSFSTKLQLTEQINRTIENRILSFIQPAFGEGRMTVAVNSILDLDAKVTETETFVPFDESNPTNNPLDYSERTWEQTGGDELAAGVPGVEDNTDVPIYAADNAALDGTGYYARRDVMDYLVSSVRDQVVKEGYDITDMTVAVMVDSAILAEGQRDQIVDLVATAAGISREKVSVQPMRFNVETDTTLPGIISPDPLSRILLFVGIGAAVLMLLLIILFVSMSRRRKKLALAAEAEQYFEDDTTLVDLLDHDVEFDPIVIQESAEQKLKAQIKDLADSDPEIVAQLIRTWLNTDL